MLERHPREEPNAPTGVGKASPDDVDLPTPITFDDDAGLGGQYPRDHVHVALHLRCLGNAKRLVVDLGGCCPAFSENGDSCRSVDVQRALVVPLVHRGTLEPDNRAGSEALALLSPILEVPALPLGARLPGVVFDPTEGDLTLLALDCLDPGGVGHDGDLDGYVLVVGA